MSRLKGSASYDYADARILQGARIGREAFIDTTDYMDLDFLDIGDKVAVGEGTTIVAHRFDGAVLRFQKVSHSTQQLLHHVRSALLIHRRCIKQLVASSEIRRS